MSFTSVPFRNGLALALISCLSPFACFAQVDPWERVKLIQPGKKIHIGLHSGQTVKGRMEQWNPETVMVRIGKDKISSVSKSDVARVALITGMSRGRKATYAGLITGGVLGGIVLAACAAGGGCEVSPPAALPLGIAAWSGVAAGIAALFPQGKEVIYIAPSDAAAANPRQPAVSAVPASPAPPTPVEAGAAEQLLVIQQFGERRQVAEGSHP